MHNALRVATLLALGLLACGDDGASTASTGAGGGATTAGEGGAGGEVALPEGGGTAGNADVVALVPVDDAIFKGPRSIVVDSTHVVWTNLGWDDYSGVVPGSVTRVPLAGGPVEVVVDLAENGRAALGVALDATTIFFTAGGGFVSPDDGTYRVPLTGGATSQIDAVGNVIAVDDTHVYWGGNDVKGTCCPGVIRRMPKGGGDVEHVATGPSLIGDMVLDATHVFWTTYESGAVMRATLDGSEVVELASGLDEPGAIVVAGDTLYVIATGGIDGVSAVLRMPTAGGEPEVVVADGSAYALGVDEDNVYWAGYESLHKVPLSGGEPVFIATGFQIPIDLAIDATHVYVADKRSVTAIWKVRK